MELFIADKYLGLKDNLLEMIEQFDHSGNLLVEGSRNRICVFEAAGIQLNIKYFQVPNFFNKLVYSYIRKSKARRSFEYGMKLLELGVLTPEPIAWAEERKISGLARSFYLSKQLTENITFRDLIEQPASETRDAIIRAFTRFTWGLHQKNILFLDHSPGNTLIKKAASGEWEFYLVDLNRMQFKTLTEKEKVNNFSRLSATPDILEIMAKEYAALSKWPIERTVLNFQVTDQRFRKMRKRKKQLKRLVKKK